MDAAIVRMCLAGLSLALSASVAGAQTHGLKFGPQKRFEVLPVLFVPSDNKEITPQAVERIAKLLYAHLELTQRRYKELLKTDTFKIANGNLLVYRSPHPHSFLTPPGEGEVLKAWQRLHPPGADTTHLATKEVLEWRRDNRYDSKYIYLIIYARPGPPSENAPYHASASQFNGSGNPWKSLTGSSRGGSVIMELSSLLFDKLTPFQAVLPHELGHAFGLTHPNCYGYSMATSQGVMSYDNGANNSYRPAHGEVRGLTPTLGIFFPEDYYALSRNRLAFANFRYDEAVHNPQRRKMDRVDTCTIGAAGPYIGEFRPQRPGEGYELFYDGNRVSFGGLDPEFVSRKFASEDCRRSKTTHKDVNVECRYNGEPLDPGPEPMLPDLAGKWCDNGKPASIVQSGAALTFTSETGNRSSGHFESNDFEVYDMVFADEWEHTLAAFISADGKRLHWANGSLWTRGSKCGATEITQERDRFDNSRIRIISAAYGGDAAHSTDVTADIGRACNGKPVCSFAVSNEFFGRDPSAGVRKRVDIRWSCGTERHAAFDEDTRAELACGATPTASPAKAITIISAIYGSDAGHSMDVTSTVGHLCSGKPACRFYMGNELFGRDPIAGVVKHLNVTWSCGSDRHSVFDENAMADLFCQ